MHILLIVLALVLVGAMTWVMMSGPNLEPQPLIPTPTVPEVPAEPEEAVLEPGPDRPLPGSGPLTVDLLYLGTEADQHLRVERQGTLFGTIYGASGGGGPLANAILRVHGGPQDGLLTRSEVDGTFELRGLLPGSHFFHIETSNGFSAVRLQRVAESRPTKRDFFLGEPLDVEFEVVDHENEPLEGAEVLVSTGLQRGTTDAKGRVLIGNVVGGRRVLVDVRSDEHVSMRFELNLFASAVSEGPYRLPALARGGTIRGQVRSWPGGPLPRLTLVPRATQPGVGMAAWESWQGIETDREGRFRIENLPTQHMIDVRVHHPWGVSDPRSRAVKPNPNTASTVDFVIREAHAKITGTVFGPNGSPAGGIEVRLAALRPGQVLGALYPGLDRSPVGVPLPTPAQMERVTTSRSDGSFEFAVGDHVEGTGSMVLIASAPGLRSVRQEVGTVGQHLEVRLRPLREDATLHLLRKDEGPLPEQAQWRLDGEMLPASDLALEGLQEGFYHLRVLRGEEVLFAHDRFRIAQGTEVDLSR